MEYQKRNVKKKKNPLKIMSKKKKKRERERNKTLMNNLAKEVED